METSPHPNRIDVTHIEYHKGDCDWSSLSSDLRNAGALLLANMWDVKLIQVPTDYANHVNNDLLFGESVKKAFPSATEDVREAGNCIVVDSGTAAVFHLMRAVEWGLRALCVDLGVLTTPHKKLDVPIEFSQWEKILDHLYPEIEKKIAAFPIGASKQEAQEFYYPLYFDIKGFKDAFRNHVSHTRQTYSQKAAADVLDYVRRFFALLSTKISE